MPSTDSLLDLGSYPEIFAHGIGNVIEVPPNIHIVLFRWRMVDGVLRRVIAAEVMRPICSVTPALLSAWRVSFPHVRSLALH